MKNKIKHPFLMMKSVINGFNKTESRTAQEYFNKEDSIFIKADRDYFLEVKKGMYTVHLLDGYMYIRNYFTDKKFTTVEITRKLNEEKLAVLLANQRKF